VERAHTAPCARAATDPRRIGAGRAPGGESGAWHPIRQRARYRRACV